MAHKKRYRKKSNICGDSFAMEFQIRRGNIYMADLDVPEPEPGIINGKRPVIVIQNNIGNKYSPTVTVVPISSSIKKVNQPTHMLLEAGEGGLSKDSIACVEQIRTISQDRIEFCIGGLTKDKIRILNDKIRIQTGLS